MGSLFSDIGLFLYTILSYWQSYVTGGVVTGTVYLVERLSGWQLTKRAFAALFVGTFLLVSFFFAWRDQLNATRVAQETQGQLKETVKQEQTVIDQLQAKVRELEKPRRPLFTGWIENYSAGTARDGTTVLWVEASIDNAPDAAPSIAEGFRLKITMPGVGQTRELFPEWGSGKEVKMLGFPEDRIYKPEDILFQKTTLQPVAPGARVSGWLKWSVPGFTRDQVDRLGTTIEISFGDLAQTVYFMRHTIDGTESSGGSHVPGIDYKIIKGSRKGSH